MTTLLPLVIKNVNELKSLLSSDRPMVLYFFASYCGYCKAFNPVFEDMAIDFHRCSEVLFAKIDAPENREAILELLPDAFIKFPTVYFKNNKVTGFGTEEWEKHMTIYPVDDRKREKMIDWLQEKSGDASLKQKRDKCRETMTSSNPKFIFVGKTDRALRDKFTNLTDGTMIDTKLANDSYRNYFTVNHVIAKQGLFREAEDGEPFPVFISNSQCYKFRDADTFFKQYFLQQTCPSTQVPECTNIPIIPKRDIRHYNGKVKSLTLVKLSLLSLPLQTLASAVCTFRQLSMGQYASLSQLLEERGGAAILFHEINKEQEDTIRGLYLLTERDEQTESFNGFEGTNIHGLFAKDKQGETELFLQNSNGDMKHLCTVGNKMLQSDILAIKRMFCDDCGAHGFLNKNQSRK